MNNNKFLKITIKEIMLVIVVFITFLVTVHCKKFEQQLKKKTPWDLMEAIEDHPTIYGLTATWISDEEFYFYPSGGPLFIYNAVTNTTTEHVSSNLTETYNEDAVFTLSPDNEKVLVKHDSKNKVPYSFKARYDIIDPVNGSTIQIHDGAKLDFCLWSPIPDRFVYVYNSNVYVHLEEGLEVRLTTEGIDGVIYVGIADWVYGGAEDNDEDSGALWWAPDGQKLAVMILNDTNVETYKFSFYGEPNDLASLYPKEVNLKFPKAGTPNPMVTLRVFDFSSGVPSSVNITAPIDIVTTEHLLRAVLWVNNDSLVIFWSNRLQNVTSIQLCTLVGVCREVRRLTEPNGWIHIDSYFSLNQSENIIFTYWVDNWYQVWNLDLNTGENIWKSRGNFTIRGLYGYDEDNEKFYYQATLRHDPSVVHVFANDKCLSCNIRGPEGEYCRSASAIFSDYFSYYILACNGPSPTFVKIMNTQDNSVIYNWENNEGYREKRAEKLEPIIRFCNVSLADGSWGMAKIYLPPNANTAKKYPMIVDVYGGPGSVSVDRDYSVNFVSYLVTKRKIIYVMIDGRGTGNRDKKFAFSVKNNLGHYEVEDQIFVTKYLQKRLSFIDSKRTGIWGWSYGGYISAKTISMDSERVFKCGISVAPVTSWLYSNSIYIERFMGLPTKEDNLQKYLESSVLNDVENFRSHDFMLIHGTGDDNVHYQQSLMLAKVLQKNDIVFEQMSYVDENHSISGLPRHLYITMDHFWMNCLNIDVADDNEQK